MPQRHPLDVPVFAIFLIFSFHFVRSALCRGVSLGWLLLLWLLLSQGLGPRPCPCPAAAAGCHTAFTTGLPGLLGGEFVGAPLCVGCPAPFARDFPLTLCIHPRKTAV